MTSTSAQIRAQANEPTHQDGRVLACTGPCEEHVRVYEPLGPWIDPREYVCGVCLTSAAAHDPTTAPFPPGF
jgi:hypothetical protein